MSPALEVPGRRLRRFVLLGVFFLSFLWELCQLAGSRESLFRQELPRWIRELGEGQANCFEKIVFIWEKAAGGGGGSSLLLEDAVSPLFRSFSLVFLELLSTGKLGGGRGHWLAQG